MLLGQWSRRFCALIGDAIHPCRFVHRNLLRAHGPRRDLLPLYIMRGFTCQISNGNKYMTAQKSSQKSPKAITATRAIHVSSLVQKEIADRASRPIISAHWRRATSAGVTREPSSLDNVPVRSLSQSTAVYATTKYHRRQLKMTRRTRINEPLMRRPGRDDELDQTSNLRRLAMSPAI